MSVDVAALGLRFYNRMVWATALDQLVVHERGQQNQWLD